MIFFAKQQRDYTTSYPKKRMKIPKEKSEAINRRTDNVIAKRKRTNGQIMTYKVLH